VRRSGNAQAGVFLQDCWRADDGRWIAVTVADAAMAAACAAVTGAAAADALALRDALARWIATLAAGDAVDALLRAGIAAAPSNDGTHLIADKDLAGVSLAWSDTGELAKGLPYALDGSGLAIGRAAPDLGQHTNDVLRDILGLSDAEIARLEAAGVTSTTPSTGAI
jgi:crotonobetainyl-CoA:carnitine CoA-transferase CaiB-like acyl-CoA transferase